MLSKNLFLTVNEQIHEMMLLFHNISKSNKLLTDTPMILIVIEYVFSMYGDMDITDKHAIFLNIFYYHAPTILHYKSLLYTK